MKSSTMSSVPVLGLKLEMRQYSPSIFYLWCETPNDHFVLVYLLYSSIRFW